jgi:hypothetical protein
LANEAAMPAQDSVGSDQTMATQRAGQPPNEGGEHGPVGVPQDEKLDVLG